MAQKAKGTYIHERVKKGTSIGRAPITSTMSKDKRRNHKKYRGQGR